MNTGSIKITDSRYSIEVTSDQREWTSGIIDIREYRVSIFLYRLEYFEKRYAKEHFTD